MRAGAFSDYKLEADREAEPIRLGERPAAAATTEQVDEQQDATRISAREEAQFWRMVLTDRIGKRVLFDLLTMLKAFESSPFSATPIGFPDPQATFFHAGQIEQGRAVYQKLAIMARKELFELQDEFHVFSGLAPRPDKV